MHILNDDFAITINNATVTITSDAFTDTFPIIHDDSPAYNRINITTPTGKIYATPLCFIVEDRREFPTHVGYSSAIRRLNRGVFDTVDGLIIFDIPNLYHPDASLANILAMGVKYTSEKVTYDGCVCTFYTSSGTVISIAHDGIGVWVSAKVNNKTYDVL